MSPLQRLRAIDLAPGRLLELLGRHRWVTINLQPGMGKTHASLQLMTDPATYDFFDLVIDLSARTLIIDEKEAHLRRADPPVSYLRIHSRPTDECGDYDKGHRDLESRGLAALGRETICSQCQQQRRGEGRPPCGYPSQWKGLNSKRLILATDFHLIQNPRFIDRFLQISERALLICDEAEFITKSWRRTIARSALQTYIRVLAKLEVDPEILVLLKRLRDQGLSPCFEFSAEGMLDRRIIQQTGFEMFPNTFEDFTGDLELLSESEPTSRIEDSKSFSFLPKIRLPQHVLFLSAQVQPEFIEMRLGKRPFNVVTTKVNNNKTRILGGVLKPPQPALRAHIKIA